MSAHAKRICEVCGKEVTVKRRVRCVCCKLLMGGCCYFSMGSRGSSEGPACRECDGDPESGWNAK